MKSYKEFWNSIGSSEILEAVNNPTSASRVLQILIEMMKDITKDIKTIHQDFTELGIEYCVIGGMALEIYNYKRSTEDIDVLISKKSVPLLKKLIGRGYTYRPGSKKNLYYHSAYWKVPVDILVEGDDNYGFIMPNPVKVRNKLYGSWYITLENLIDLKEKANRAVDINDVEQLKRINGL
jgi:predicted nucleotidyltransferase